jgi:hypothetical protein
MKRLYLTLFAAFLFLTPVFGAGIENTTYSNLVAGISRVRAPVVTGRYVVFTASGKARYTGIAFEYENYRKTYSFQKMVRKGPDGKPEIDENGRQVESVLFYITEIPPGLHELRYRMVIDGLWTTDPMNAKSVYDYDNGMQVSTLPVEYYEIFQTANVSKGQVRFTYEGTPGSDIRLAGTFNNWDPFMYEMTEISPGKYELELPLPAGTWYYAYFDGMDQLPDTTNHNRVYTADGRIASVVSVK